MGKISGLPGKHKYHCEEIPELWFKVDIIEILQGRVALMFPNEQADQHVVEDARGSCTIWNQKYLKVKM